MSAENPPGSLHFRALVVALVVALFAYQLPPALTLSAAGYGAAFGLFPISWIVFWAITLYRVTVETGKFEVIKLLWAI